MHRWRDEGRREGSVAKPEGDVPFEEFAPRHVLGASAEEGESGHEKKALQRDRASFAFNPWDSDGRSRWIAGW